MLSIPPASHSASFHTGIAIEKRTAIRLMGLPNLHIGRGDFRETA